MRAAVGDRRLDHDGPHPARRPGDRRDGRALTIDGTALPGLYEAAGRGMHGCRTLEGTFLGGCLFSSRQAGRAIAAAL